MRTILNDKQIFFINEFKKNPYFKDNFYLTGGTALAEFYLRHRLSEDLDFFTRKDFNHQLVDLFINKLGQNLKPKEIYRQKIYDRLQFEFCFKDNVLKVEFVKYEFKNLKPLKLITGVLVNDVFDIAVNKLFAIFDRNEVKDFVDLYFLLKKFTLKQLLAGVEKKFGYKVHLIALGGDLLKVKNTKLMPKMIKKLTREELISFFENEAYKLRKEIFNE